MRLFLLSIAFGFLAISSCKKNPKPVPEPAQEEFDATDIQFILLNPNGTETTDTSTIHFNRSGQATPEVVDLQPNKNYRMLITLFQNGQSVNSEIREEATLHQFFFLPSQTGIFSYSYQDADTNGRGIGLDGEVHIQGSGNLQLKVILRHGLDKSLPGAINWNSSTYETAGGEDDLNISFQIFVP